uniref:Decorin n=1 Tax=Saimiri boliviensis boliviensis TaxID=39432 RepID=A0A2K6UKL8_SAIBB
MKATIILLLLAQLSWAGPFQQRGLFDFMLEDEASGIGPDDRYDPGLEPPLGPVCPFRCQCHLRVVQCSDLDKYCNNLSLYNLYTTNCLMLCRLFKHQS